MSQFSNQLRIAIEAGGLSQLGLSERSGISQAQISRYLAGDPPHRPPPEALESLIEALPKSRSNLVIAYLEDELTPKLRSRYEISERSAERSSGRVKEEP